MTIKIDETGVQIDGKNVTPKVPHFTFKVHMPFHWIWYTYLVLFLVVASLIKYLFL